MRFYSCFLSISNFPYDCLSRTTYICMNNITPMHIVCNIIEIKNVFYLLITSATFWLKNSSNCMKYFEIIDFKTFYNEIDIKIHCGKVRLCLVRRNLLHSLRRVFFAKRRNKYHNVLIFPAKWHIFMRDMIVFIDVSCKIHCHWSAVFLDFEELTRTELKDLEIKCGWSCYHFCRGTKFNEMLVNTLFLFCFNGEL